MAEPLPTVPEPDPASLLEAATRLHQEGDLVQAGAGYEAVLAADPRNFTALHLLGLVRRQQGRPEEALGFFTEALRLAPRSLLARENLGLALLDLHRPEEALAEFQLALVLKPDDRGARLACAAALRTLGRPAEALDHLERAVAVHGEFPEALLNRAVVLTDLERPEEALACLDHAFGPDRASAEALLARGNAERLRGRPEAALACYAQALAARPAFPEALLNQGNLLLDLDRPAEALASFEACLAHQPGDPEALLSAGNALGDLGRPDAALARYEEAIARRPRFAHAHFNRGRVLQLLARKEEALRAYEQALALDPDRIDALINRATLLHQSLRHGEALESLARARTLQPDHTTALVNTGLILLDLGRAQEALEIFDRILAHHPDHREALVSRGASLLDLQRPDDALAHYGRIEPRLQSAEALLNRGVALHQLGRHPEALASYDAALRIRPEFAVAHSNRIFLLDYLPDLDFAQHQAERAAYCRIQTRALPPPGQDHPNLRDPDRRLVVGYVSADFRHHSAAACFGPVLLRHDRNAFKVVCYSGVLAEDDWTRTFQERADLWRVTAALSDEDLAEQIRRDAVDILVDLSGHSKGNRLLVFARKPAPIQVTAWGHTGGTGLPAVDYQFTDPVMVPPEVRHLFAEASVDLPCSITFEAPPDTPEVTGPPVLSRGAITFGSLNRLNKTSPEALRLWARILRAVPGSRLLLKDVALDEAHTRDALLETLSGLGVDPDRVDLRGFSDRRSHLATYGEIDIAFDTFPQNGGITTWEALWMGVPVLALVRDRPACRLSAAILHAVGLDSWVARTEEGYVERAVGLAENPGELRRFRETARARIRASDVGNPQAYTRAVERAYRGMWSAWLQQHPEGGGQDALAEAIARHEQGDLAAAEARYRGILATDPGDFTATHLFGLLKGQQGDDLAALGLFDTALRLNPRSLAARLNRGAVLRRLGRAEEALAEFSQARVLKPGHPETLLATALLLHDLGRTGDALDCLDRLLGDRPELVEAWRSRGLVLLDVDRPGEALEAFARAAEGQPDDPINHLNLAQALAALGRPGEALAGYQQALALRPGWEPAALAAAALHHQERRPQAALQLIEGLLAADPDNPHGLLNAGILLRELGRPQEALGSLERLLEREPEHTEGGLNRARALRDLRRPEAALEALDRLLERLPDHTGALVEQANALLDLQRPAEALTCLDRVLVLQPEDPVALSNRGNAVLTMGDPAAALADYDRALAADPRHADALLNRGTALLELQRPEEALESFDRALVQRPDWAEGHMNRATALVALRRMEHALEAYDRALALRPRQAEILINRGTALHRMGRHREAIADYDRALALEPANRKAHSNRIFVLDYLPDVDCAGHQQARRDCCRALGYDLPVPPWQPDLDRDPDRPLRVGYVSADFKRHSAASCFGPVLLHHDRSALCVTCYSGTSLADDWTARFRAAADHWVDTAGLSDTALVERIRADRIDILVDLSGHSEGNRLGVFARRAAPIQVTAWGHGGGTGLPAMDVQFTDPVAIPVEVRSLFAEASWDLPCCITFEAPGGAPDPGPAPACAGVPITFGCLSRFMKASPEALDLWGRILQRLPGSRLLLKDALLDDPRVRSSVQQHFERFGVGGDRLLIRGATSHLDHLASYRQVDIVLDTFPQNGGITTWEALWMGSPVVALRGGKPPERISAAILHALGLDEWIADSPDGCLALAIRAAADPSALAAFRAGIRPRILASPAGDPARYTRAVEAAYRSLWSGWLARSAARGGCHG